MMISVAVMALMACDPQPLAPDAPSAEATVTALGKAHLAQPLTGATLTVRSPSGEVVVTAPVTTGSAGTFLFPLPETVGPAFRLEVSGGAYAGVPFRDTLALDVEHFDATKDLLYVNAVTTMVAMQRDRHPGLSLANAEQAVRGFLGIPSSVRLGIDLDSSKELSFSHAELVAKSALSTTGLLRPDLETLLNEFDAGVASHHFVPRVAPNSFLEDMVKKLLGALGHQIAETIGDGTRDWVFETILSSLGLGPNAETQHKLEQISEQIKDLQKSVEQVLSEEKQTQAEVVTVATLSAVHNIRAQYDFLQWLAQHSNGSTDAKLPETVKERMDAIIDPNVGVIAQMELIQGALVSSGPEKGILQRWSDFFDSERPFSKAETDTRLIAVLEYYRAVQLAGITLVAEAYAGKQQPTVAQYYFDRYSQGLEAQEQAMAAMHAPAGTLRQVSSGLIWRSAPKNRLPTRTVDTARMECQALNRVAFGGLTTWRLPTKAELTTVAKAAPEQQQLFGWLIEQGFEAAPEGDTGAYTNGFFTDNNAYLSSELDGSDNYPWALWHDGVDYACLDPNRSDFGTCQKSPTSFGAWCVAPPATERAEK